MKWLHCKVVHEFRTRTKSTTADIAGIRMQVISGECPFCGKISYQLLTYKGKINELTYRYCPRCGRGISTKTKLPTN